MSFDTEAKKEDGGKSLKMPSHFMNGKSSQRNGNNESKEDELRRNRMNAELRRDQRKRGIIDFKTSSASLINEVAGDGDKKDPEAGN